MQQQDQTERIDAIEDSDVAEQERAEEVTPAEVEDEAGADVQSQPQRRRFDWPALIVALLIGAFFALTARFNSQPSPSYIPAAVFSATGCGLLVTALRKLRSLTGVGLLEAGLAGFGVALLQFAVAFTYPSVFSTVTTLPSYSRAFLITWGLVALFAVVLSLAGAAIGHLAFAPPRPLPAHAQKQKNRFADEDEEEEDEEESEDEEDVYEQAMEAEQDVESESAQSEQADETAESEHLPAEPVGEDKHEDDAKEEDGDTDEEDEDDEEEEQEDEDDSRVAKAGAQPRPSLLSYAITVLLLGVLPMMAGYVFAATYDFIMNAIHIDQISPALYPTLSLLGGLLPWRLAAPINLSSANGAFIVFTLLWRIPDSVLGNPNLFDVQALEAYLFNAIGLALLLLTMYGSDRGENKRQAAPWGIFLSLEALLGLIIVLPASLWIQRGLEGVLQLQSLVAQLPTIQLLNPALFALNLVTGALFCFLVGLLVRRQYQLWTTPRRANPEPAEEQIEVDD